MRLDMTNPITARNLIRLSCSPNDGIIISILKSLWPIFAKSHLTSPLHNIQPGLLGSGAPRRQGSAPAATILHTFESTRDKGDRGGALLRDLVGF